MYNDIRDAGIGWAGDCCTPGLRQNEMGAGVGGGGELVQNVSSHLSKFCHQNPVFLHQLR